LELGDHFMQRFLITATAAAVALTLAGRVFAQSDHTSFLPRLVQNQTSGNPSPAKSADEAGTSAAADPGPVGQQLKELAETRLQQYVPREQDRAGVLAFYRKRNFEPLWAAEGAVQPKAEQAAGFLAKVGADGLDPADYAVPKFDTADPAKLAVDELTMTNAVLTFARHASIGRVAFTRVSGAVYFDQKAPDPR
jgi:murein L,D-transpeptidase YcbB/YkuD